MFNPNETSVILALNYPTREQDIAVIRKFYTGEITKTIGFWKGEKENSYQLDMCLTDEELMVEELVYAEQEAFIMTHLGAALLHTIEDFGNEVLGELVEVDCESDCCTYCPESDTYWRAIL